MVVAPSDFDFEAALSKLRNAVEKDFAKGSKPNEYITVFQQISGSDNDRKSASDQCIKSTLQNHLKTEKPKIDRTLLILQFGTACARKGIPEFSLETHGKDFCANLAHLGVRI